MRTAWVNSSVALKARMVAKAQVPDTGPDSGPEAGMPPYMESFLAHLRMLVGVPFDYLIPDARLLPPESIRFFYLDRSWTDRLVDGAVTVGKIGTREQAHHQAHSPAVQQQLDITERMVRALQKGKGSFTDLKGTNDVQNNYAATAVTGFLLRSSAVSGWPHMEVRAYNQVIPERFNASDYTGCQSPGGTDDKPCQLRTLRLERLSPSVMFGLFEGVPKLVFFEEPHHGVQFGVTTISGVAQLDLRDSQGHQILISQETQDICVPVRTWNNRVIAVTALRDALAQQRSTFPQMPPQDGSANFAVEVLNPPWRQRFEGTEDKAGGTGKPGRVNFVPKFAIASRVQDYATVTAFKQVVVSGH
jgi:hypothetical protein